MREIAADVARWRAAGHAVALATVVATRRSAPRPVGSKLAVCADRSLSGSVSGGCVEADVARAAEAVLAGGPPQLLTYGIADETAFEIGLPCGGEIDVFIEPAEPWHLERLVAESRDHRTVDFTALDGPELGRHWTADDDPAPVELERATAELLREGRSRVVTIGDRLLFAEVHGPPPVLVVVGAVDTAEALCRAAKTLGWHTVVVDARKRFATPERLPSADELVVAWPDEAFARVRPDADTAVVVLTHEERFDVPALKAALATDAFYVGALGSRRTQARRRGLLLDAGVAGEQLDRIAGPCGLDVGARSPAEVAISILAEILAARAGRDGGPLRKASGRIHAGVGSG